MRKKLAFVVFTAALLGATPAAFAGSRGESMEPEEGPAPVAVAPAVVEEEGPSGYPYIGAAGIFAFENFHCDVDHAWGYGLRAGYRINDYVGVEAEGQHMVDKFDDADKVDGFGNLDGDVEAWNVTANARVYPVKGRFQPFIKVGAGYGEANLPHDDNGGFVAKFGLGIDVLITDNFGVTTGADYVLGTDSVSDYDYIPLSLGIFYNFI